MSEGVRLTFISQGANYLSFYLSDSFVFRLTTMQSTTLNHYFKCLPWRRLECELLLKLVSGLKTLTPLV